MAFEVFGGKTSVVPGNLPVISMAPKIGRILVFKATQKLLDRQYGKPVRYVQILTDPAKKDVYLIRPCAEDAGGARKINMSPGTANAITVKGLFKALGMPKEAQTTRYKCRWNKQHQALLVDLKSEM